MSSTRLFYIDNLRVFLICLVVMLHLNITYGAPGDWCYEESQAGVPEIYLQGMFNMTNQAFFMGMFFFISAFFTAASIQRKSTGKFLNDRLVRLGIPLVVFYFVLHPLTHYILRHYIRNEDISFLAYAANPRAWGFGPLWFVETLLIFTVIYLLIRKLNWKIKMKYPGTGTILLAALTVGFLQYLIRIWLPAGWSLPHTGLQFPFFVQYIFMLIFGVVAWNNNWLDSIEYKNGLRWFLFAQFMILIVLPVGLYLGAKDKGIEVFMGGGSWQSLFWALWEQVVGFAMIIGLLALAKRFRNKQGWLGRQLSGSAYGVYIIHAPIIVGLAALFVHWDINQLLKFMAVTPIALFTCFLLAWGIKQIPGVKRVV